MASNLHNDRDVREMAKCLLDHMHVCNARSIAQILLEVGLAGSIGPIWADYIASVDVPKAGMHMWVAAQKFWKESVVMTAVQAQFLDLDLFLLTHLLCASMLTWKRQIRHEISDLVERHVLNPL